MNSNNCQGERIHLATRDTHCIAVDKLHGNIIFQGTERADIACIFRKQILETKTWPCGRVETVFFALDCHQDFYLTISSRRHLELNFRTSIPRIDVPDERIFDVYFTKQRHVLIQPKLHSNTYLYHIDNVLNAKPLDLNGRCPEEYFFYIDALPENPEQKVVKKIFSADMRADEIITCNPVSDVNTAKVNDISMNKKKLVKQITGINELPLTKSAENKTPLSTLFFGCFSGVRNQNP